MLVSCCANDALQRGKVCFAPDVHVDELRQEELKVDGDMVPKEEDLIQVTDIF